MLDDIRKPAGQAPEQGPIAAVCARIFRHVADLKYSQTHFTWNDERLLQEPLEAFQVDSLTLLEFVMAVEEEFNVEIDEDEVNACTNVGDLVRLVTAARDGSESL
jgi:acyl carrier protein